MSDSPNALSRLWRHLFGREDDPTTAPTQVQAPPTFVDKDADSTQPLPDLAELELPEAAKSRPDGARHFVLGIGQDTGMMRTHNEDALLAFTGELAGHDPMPAFGVFVIADGMGGHSLGERASGVAARTAAQTALGHLLPSLLADPGDDDLDRPLLGEVVEEAVMQANRAVHDRVPDGGTTLTTALILGEQLVLGHVGDSRCYLINAEGLEQLTRDHSLVQRLKELGQITDEEAAVHPQRSVLYRAVGQGEGLEVDVISRRLEPGSRVLLCSDGLWGLVPDHTMLQLIRSASSLQAACDSLIMAANAAGGPDNISVVIVQLPN